MKMAFVFSNGSNINLKMAFSAIIYRQALHNGETIQIDVHLNGDDLINFIRFLLILQSRWSVPFFIDFIPDGFKFLHYPVSGFSCCWRSWLWDILWHAVDRTEIPKTDFICLFPLIPKRCSFPPWRSAWLNLAQEFT